MAEHLRIAVVHPFGKHFMLARTPWRKAPVHAVMELYHLLGANKE